MSVCHYCGPTDRELRPYGPGGSDICHPCMMEDPGRERAAAGVFGALLEANAAIGDDVVVIGGSGGPRPAAARELTILAALVDDLPDEPSR